MAGKIDEGMIASVLAQLEACAARGEACPTNEVLCARYGLHAPQYGSRLIRALERRGLILVERGAKTRVVTILASGARTAGAVIGRRIPRGQGTGYREPRPKAAKEVAAPAARAKTPKAVVAAPMPNAQPTPRPPTPRGEAWAPPLRDHGGGCRFIDGQPGRTGWTWCGAPRLDGGSWCAGHHARVYIRRPRLDGVKGRGKGR
ncbi:hypothetical protein [Zavarzinia aquatilis]|nr:hypothetical protein [Zavarzinia aquatilis]